MANFLSRKVNSSDSAPGFFSCVDNIISLKGDFTPGYDPTYTLFKQLWYTMYLSKQKGVEHPVFPDWYKFPNLYNFLGWYLNRLRCDECIELLVVYLS